MDLKDLNLSFTEIAKRVGENWQALSPTEKEPFESQAAAAKERYNTEMTTYKQTESYREYLRYLTDFKLKNPIPQAGEVHSSQPGTGNDPLILDTGNREEATTPRDGDGGAERRDRQKLIGLGRIDAACAFPRSSIPA